MLDDTYHCSLVGCEFKISEKRLTEITADMRRPRSKREIAIAEANLSDLNNFGHRIPSVDYSDEIEKL